MTEFFIYGYPSANKIWPLNAGVTLNAYIRQKVAKNAVNAAEKS